MCLLHDSSKHTARANTKHDEDDDDDDDDDDGDDDNDRQICTHHIIYVCLQHDANSYVFLVCFVHKHRACEYNMMMMMTMTATTTTTTIGKDAKYMFAT